MSASSSSSPPSLPPPIALRPPGSREVVDETRAHAFVESWKSELDAHRSAVASALASSSGRDASSISPSELPPPCDEVVLSDKSYTAGAASVLFSFFTRGSPPLAAGVTRLNLADVIASRMEEEGLQVLRVLCDAFEHSELEEVDLSDNAMGSKGIGACRSVLVGQASSLERLSLCNNGLSAQSMEEVADILTGAALKREGTEDDAAASDGSVVCERLSKIHFFNNMSGDGGCRAFARILHRCTDRLADVRFSGTRAGRDGSLVVASALDEMEDRVRNLRRLDLADNSFGLEGSAGLFRCLTRCRSLTCLNLRDCVLEDDGVRQICHALWSADVPLEHLDLSGNEMTRKGAKALAEFLEENLTVRVLHAEENEMTSLGVKYLAAALSGGALASAEEGSEEKGGIGAAIEEIRLGQNQCGVIGARALLDAYRGGEGMPNLRRIELDDNGFPAEEAEDLRQAFGDKLGEMEENDEDADYDDDLDEDEDDDEGGDDEDDVQRDGGGAGGSRTVDALADAVAKGVNIC